MADRSYRVTKRPNVNRWVARVEALLQATEDGIDPKTPASIRLERLASGKYEYVVTFHDVKSR